MKLSIVTWNCEGPLYCGKEFETEKIIELFNCFQINDYRMYD